MIQKKFLVVIILCFLLGFGWLVAINAATGVKEAQEQAELVYQADEFYSKQLYVRAIPLYEDALKIKTEKNDEIEMKLLRAYRDSENTDEYSALVNKRILVGLAREEEYLECAKAFLLMGDLEAAMKIAKAGVDNLGTENLKAFYEEHRYSYYTYTTSFLEIIPTETNELMPAVDADGWHYVDNSGRIEINGPYESATPFNADGYGVIKKDGRFYTILSTGEKYGIDETGVSEVYALTDSHILAKYQDKYSYYNYDFEPAAEGHQYESITKNSCGVAAVKKNGKWGIISDSGEVMVEFELEDVAINSLGQVFVDGFGMVKMDGKWCMIDTEGNVLLETDYTAVKAPESAEGYIAVMNDQNLWGFMNLEGTEVIPCTYEDALSFSDGLAAVKGVSNWKYINKENVVKIDLLMENALPFHNGIAQTLMIDGVVLISLEYIEE